MNAPDRFELFMLDTDTKVAVQKDTKLQDAAAFTIQKEDHTLGNLVRMQLLRDPQVLFAGYRVPHPLENFIVFKIQTRPETTPQRVLEEALTDLNAEISLVSVQFEDEVARWKSRGDQY